MTPGDLAVIMVARKEIKAIEEQLKVVRTTVSSPRLGGVPSRPAGGSRTERAAIMAAELEDRLEGKRKELIEAMEKAEAWMAGIGDPLVAASVRLHYVAGMSWGETSKAVYGPRAGKETARMAVHRYMRPHGL